MRTLGRRYRLEAELGSGGMAVVHRAYDTVLGRAVAVKVLAPTLADRAARERIRAEAQVAARLAHPNVAGVYDFGESRQGRRKAPYIVMELVHGDTLAARQGAGPMHWRTAVGIAAETSAALAAAHACGVVHRDVKPGNIILARTGVKVVDFGIAAAVGALDERGADLLGTPAYVAPERLVGGPAAPSTDVYALGVLLYECLAGTLPWPAYTVTDLVTAHRDLPPAPLPPVDGLPPDVVELCEQCLSKDPDQRPSSLYAAVVLAEAAGMSVTLPAVVPDPASDVMAAASPAASAAPALVPEVEIPTGALAPARPRLLARVSGRLRPARRIRSHAAAEGGRRRASADGRTTTTGAPMLAGGVGRALGLGGLAALLAMVGLLLGGAFLLGGGDGLEGRSGRAAAPGGGCAAHYVAQPRVGGGFTAELAITNTGAQTLDRWSLEFALPAGQRITGVAGVPFDQRGQAVTLHGVAPLPAGDTQRLSLTGTVVAAAPDTPTRFVLDGASCTRSAGNPPN